MYIVQLSTARAEEVATLNEKDKNKVLDSNQGVKEASFKVPAVWQSC
jgi:hypothetical protein